MAYTFDIKIKLDGIRVLNLYDHIRVTYHKLNTAFIGTYHHGVVTKINPEPKNIMVLHIIDKGYGRKIYEDNLPTFLNGASIFEIATHRDLMQPEEIAANIEKLKIDPTIYNVNSEYLCFNVLCGQELFDYIEWRKGEFESSQFIIRVVDFIFK